MDDKTKNMYKELDSEHKNMVDYLIRLCFQEQQAELRRASKTYDIPLTDYGLLEVELDYDY